MRFAVIDSSDEDEIASLDLSSDSEGSSSSSSRARARIPRSMLGRDILDALDSSDEDISSVSDLDSEDEVLLGLDSESSDGWEAKKRAAPKSTSKVSVAPSTSIKGKAKAVVSNGHWKLLNVSRSSKPMAAPGKGKAKLKDLIDDEPSQYDQWLESTDKAAWRDGQRAAHVRRGELRVIASNARARHQEGEARRAEVEDEELGRLLAALDLKHSREEEERTKRFEERQTRLWAEIDAAIADVEKHEAERAAAAAAAAQKKKEEEAARVAAAERIAQAKKAEEERRKQEQSAEEERAKQARAADERRKAAEKEEAEAQAKVAAEKGKAGGEWRKSVDKQRWMKKEVIEVVKADRATKMALRQGMRLMTRGLGQVVNTRESIVRVTNDLHDILIQQLPSPPSASSPTLFDPSPNPPLPKPYLYLLSHVAKALVKQAENEVNAKPDAAFPLARIVLGLLLRGHAAFGEVLFARFVKKCPWVVPFYPARQPDQPREEYEKSTGRGSDESIADYISRMAGICTLYFAILQTPLSSLIPTLGPSSALPTPDQLERQIDPSLRLPSAWTWLSHSLRAPMPALAPTAHLVITWIEILASTIANTYGPGQLDKLLEVIVREGLEGGAVKGDSQATRERLGLVIRDARGGGKVPQGREWE